MGDTSPFDEMHGTDGAVREPYMALDAWLREQPEAALALMAADAEAIFRRLGITFAVYGSAEATEKIIRSTSFPASSRPPSGAGSAAASSSACGRSTPSLYGHLPPARDHQAGPRAREPDPQQFGFPARNDGHGAGARHLRATSSASTSCGWGRTSSTCSRTICARRPAVSYMLEDRERCCSSPPNCSSGSRSPRSKPIRKICAARSKAWPRPPRPAPRPSPC